MSFNTYMPLPPYTELGYACDSQGPRIDTIYFHGATILVNHEARGAKGERLTNIEKTVLALGAIGMTEENSAALQYKSVATIGNQLRVARRKMLPERPVPRTTAAAVSRAFDLGLWHVHTPAKPNPDLSPTFFAMSAAFAGGYARKDFEGCFLREIGSEDLLKNINTVKNFLQHERGIAALLDAPAQVLYSYAVEDLKPRYLEDNHAPWPTYLPPDSQPTLNPHQTIFSGYRPDF